MLIWAVIFIFVWIVIGYLYNHLTAEPEDEQDECYYD